MFLNDFETTILNAFGLPGLRLNYPFMTDDGKLRIQYFWGILISNNASFTDSESFLVTVIKTDKWHKALILPPPLNDRLAVENIQAIEIEHWIDPIAEYLQQCSFSSQDAEYLSHIFCKISFSNYAGYGQLETMNGTPKNLADSAFSAINIIKSKYKVDFTDSYFSSIDHILEQE